MAILADITGKRPDRNGIGFHYAATFRTLKLRRQANAAAYAAKLFFFKLLLFFSFAIIPSIFYSASYSL